MRHSRAEPAPGLNGGGNPEAFDALPALIEKLLYDEVDSL
jgi:hypothetical protein